MSDSKSGTYYFVITEDIAKSDLTPAQKLVACSIVKRTRDRGKTDFMLLRAAWIMEDWSMTSDVVTDSLKRLIQMGVIEKKRSSGGNLVRWVGWATPGMDESDWDAIRDNPESDSGKVGIAIRQKAESDSVKSGIPCIRQNPESNLSNVPSNGHTSEQQQTEPVVVGRESLPTVKANTTPVLTSRSIRPVPEPVHVGALNARMMQLLGGRESEVMGHLSQDMVDCGYLAFALDELAARKGTVTKPVGWMVTILRAYKPGWSSPAKAASADVAARRARLAAVMV
ncbi:hypothetical protein UFOVP184_19 [uncultured Caudovirales phage]|uniref:Uncharacterized protein n=1 Tax=uncultured Caudovirales phage TaxID=2100421 RepID=A0A6J7WCG7_9CAUD|nr:hypothetical protein UFOVP184_19 [uncultured Caudovirales phage]